MKIEKAIEILSEYVYEDKPCPVGLYDKATRLSIEALKAIAHFRSLYMPGICPKLPSETDD